MSGVSDSVRPDKEGTGHNFTDEQQSVASCFQSVPYQVMLIWRLKKHGAGTPYRAF